MKIFRPESVRKLSRTDGKQQTRHWKWMPEKPEDQDCAAGAGVETVSGGFQ